MMPSMRPHGWSAGEVVCRREVLGLGAATSDRREPRPLGGRVWFGLPVHIVQDTDDALISYIGPGAEFGFVDGRWPTADGRHPWRAEPVGTATGA